MKIEVLIILIMGLLSFHEEALAKKTLAPQKTKRTLAPKSVPKKIVTVQTPPSAQAAAASAPVVPAKPEPLQPPMIEYKYEVNMAPLALLANWYTVDLLKYDPPTGDELEQTQFGYGVTAVSFIRNNNNAGDTFPNRAGYGVGATAVWDQLDYYYATHVYYEKFERYQEKGTMVQEREGFRVNAVIGMKELIKKRFALKFGWGVEAQTYRVREFNELNRFVQTNYNTHVLNPFFLECKLAMYF